MSAYLWLWLLLHGTPAAATAAYDRIEAITVAEDPEDE